MQCMKIDAAEWQRELISQTELFLMLHDRLPKELIFQRELLIFAAVSGRPVCWFPARSRSGWGLVSAISCFELTSKQG